MARARQGAFGKAAAGVRRAGFTLAAPAFPAAAGGCIGC